MVAATPPEERKRQECIYELIYTEEDFSKDLDYVHNVSLGGLVKGYIRFSYTKGIIALCNPSNDYRHPEPRHRTT